MNKPINDVCIDENLKANVESVIYRLTHITGTAQKQLRYFIYKYGLVNMAKKYLNRHIWRQETLVILPLIILIVTKMIL